MPKRVKQERRPRDVNQLAHRLVEMTTEHVAVETPPPVPVGLSEYMAALGRKGGEIGGKRRLATMTAKQRKAAATKAAKARWSRAKKP